MRGSATQGAEAWPPLPMTIAAMRVTNIAIRAANRGAVRRRARVLLRSAAAERASEMFDLGVEDGEDTVEGGRESAGTAEAWPPLGPGSPRVAVFLANFLAFSSFLFLRTSAI